MDGYFCRTTSLASVRPEEPWPLVEDLVFRGCINLMTGRPGSGKTCVAADIAAKVTQAPGTRFAGCDGHAGLAVTLEHPGTVLFMSTDEPVAVSFLPRLPANGGDLERAFRIDEAIGIDAKGSDLTLTNLAPFESALRRHRPVLVIIDGMVAYTGDANIFRPSDVVSFQGIARSELLIGRKPDTKERGLFPIKQNYARRDLEPLAFRLEDAEIQDGAGRLVVTCRVAWEGVSALELKDLFRKGPGTSKLEEAKEFLRDRLGSGDRVPVKQVEKEAPAAWRTVERAKNEPAVDGFEIRSSPDGVGGPRLWWHEREAHLESLADTEELAAPELRAPGSQSLAKTDGQDAGDAA